MSIFNSILFLKADSNYTIIHYLDGSKRIVCSTLKKMEVSLNGKGFFRVHHSYLINEQFIKGVTQVGLLLENGNEIPLSRKISRKEIKKRFFLQLGHVES